MITKLKLKNVKIDNFCVASDAEVNLKEGLNIVTVDEGNFIIGIINYLTDRLFEKHRCYELLKIKPYIDKNDLSYLEIYCTFEDKILKYSSTYADMNLFTETLMLDNELIGYWDCFDNSLETGKLWDRLGEMDDLKIDTRLLCNTIGGRIIENALKDYLICNTNSLFEFSRKNIESRLIFHDLNVIDDLNNIYNAFGFGIRIDKNDYLVYHQGKDNEFRLSMSQEGTGFLKLLNILPEIIYCMKKDKSLSTIIPLYGTGLHFLVKKALKNFLRETGLNIIATDWKEIIEIEKEKGC